MFESFAATPECCLSSRWLLYQPTSPRSPSRCEPGSSLCACWATANRAAIAHEVVEGGSWLCQDVETLWFCESRSSGWLRSQSRANLSQLPIPCSTEKYRKFCDFRLGWAVPSRRKIKDRAAIGAKFPTPASREFLH